MKRSKLFLTGSLLVMAIAAVAATKGMKRVVSFYYYQKGTACVYVPASKACSEGPSGCLYTDGSNIYSAFAARQNATTCITPLQQD